jgi:type I restriction enzyme, R subunit
MTIDVKEKEFENAIESILLEGNYESRLSKDHYDKKRALDPELVIRFIKDTQLEQYKQLQQIKKEDTDNVILNELEKNLDQKGTLHVIKNNISVSGILFKIFFPKPPSKLNEDTNLLYEKNILSIIRQLYYSLNNQNSIDIVLFVNGIPVTTIEIKNPLTGQTFVDAMNQFKNNRDPEEKLFQFNKRTVVHFAVDSNEIHYTTKLNKEKTQFFPFNKGREYFVKDKKFTSAGNPDNSSYKTEYFWKEILQKNSLLDILSNFIHLQSKQTLGREKKEWIIFPRYHQLDAVRKLVKDTKLGSRYLIQHSTGGGKSNTIGWLAFKLISLFDEQGTNPVFDSVLVISDRVLIVEQLAETIQQFEQVPGVVEEIKDTSSLVKNLGNDRKILVSTQQKFLNLLEKLETRKGKNFAIIIDESHSSQSGKSATKRDQTLTEDLTTEEQTENAIEENIEGRQDVINNHIKQANKKHERLSYYAFTATPKETTLQLFGNKIKPKCFEPFHKYSMRQAIQEDFILDVLKNYTTYEQRFKIHQTSNKDKIVEGKKAHQEIMKFVESHEQNLAYKSKIIVEHFQTHSKHKIGGMAKAMVVAPSRLAAVRYKKQIDNIIEIKKYSGISTLVAFSGTVVDGEKKFTELSINKIKNSQEITEKFDSQNYNILIVADKYQTGFDQPFLHTMYVDKKMWGIQPIQTLSRLNRTTRGKDDTFVLDFKNSSDDIKDAFEPYYDGASLSDSSDLKVLDELFKKILNFEIITKKIIQGFSNVYFKKQSEQTVEDQGKLYSIYDQVVANYDKLQSPQQEEFQKYLIKYVEIFRFLSNVVPVLDEEIHGLYGIGVLMFTHRIFDVTSSNDIVKDDIALEYYRLKKISQKDISLSGEGTLVSGGKVRKPKRPDEAKSLIEIIKDVNTKYSDIEITVADETILNQIEKELLSDPDFLEIAANSDSEDILGEYRKKVREKVANYYDTNPYFVKQYFDNKEFENEILLKGIELYQKQSRGEIKTIILSPGKQLESKKEYKKNIEKFQGRINWFDRYYGKDTLEFLDTCVLHESVKEIKILAGINSEIDNSFLEQFKKFKTKYENCGISCEMKIIIKKDLFRDLHWRIIVSDNFALTTESQKTIDLGSWGAIFPLDPKEIPYEEWWNNTDCVDIIDNWDKIKSRKEQLEQYRRN